jgi:hypothetical protein
MGWMVWSMMGQKSDEVGEGRCREMSEIVEKIG